MPDNKRPAARKTPAARPSNAAATAAPEDDEDALTQTLCDMALANTAGAPDPALNKLVRKCLLQKNDEVLYESIERARDVDAEAASFLKECIEEAAGTIVTRREGGHGVEVNAFMVPFFARTPGGLKRDIAFQDDAAFNLLRESFKGAQLESPDASVVLVGHAYHLDEIDSIAYSDLNEMVREATASMSGKKIAATPAIERSVSGWPENAFAPNDLALELRFLLGFALKATDDPFYQVPAGEAAADAWFDQRAQRFEAWTRSIAPVLARCLVSEGTPIDIDFLYQDLFHGAKEFAMTEYFTLQMMSELKQALEAHGAASSAIRAEFGPVELQGRLVWQVSLYDGAVLVASSHKPLTRELAEEAADTVDALATLGVAAQA